jgi:predicted nucleotidyltransferase
VEKAFRKISEKAKDDKDVLAVILFGSYARNEKYSDIDVCIVLEPAKRQSLFLSKKRLEYLAAFPNLDIQIFQQLPIYVKMRVLRDGKTIFCRNEDLLYDLCFSTIRQFEYFKPRYLSYLEGVLHAG